MQAKKIAFKAFIDLADIPPWIANEKMFATYCLLTCTRNPVWKTVYSKGKEFAPPAVGANPFL